MKKIPFLLTLPWFLFAGYSAHISPITPTIKSRMLRGHSWHRGCPVPLSSLRYLQMTYRGFDGRDHSGKMIVHANVANEVTQIFGELYRSGYPIRKMRLVSRYQANDHASIEADNTSAFNCRAVTGGTKWSNHSYGTAIDINPLENPYISRSGHIAHRASLKYRKRAHIGPHPRSVIVRGDTIIRVFKNKGWRWGGDWRRVKDYQHFDKPGAQRGRIPHVPAQLKHTKASSHIVKPGETLYQIAKKFGVSPKDILNINPEITDPSKIRVGQHLKLPKK